MRGRLGNEASPTREGRLDDFAGVAKRVTISLVAGTGVRGTRHGTGRVGG